MQFALRHAAAALWKALLEHTQLMSVLEREERVREGRLEVVDEVSSRRTRTRKCMCWGTKTAVSSR